MGVLADLLANASTVDTSLPREASDRVFVRKINGVLARLGRDPDYPTGLDTATNEVQTIAADGGSPSAGTYTLTFNLFGGITFTTANIAYDANATTIRNAINVAAAQKVPGWTNGDIAVTGGPLSTTLATFTYSGASVAAKNHSALTINGAGITGGTAGAVNTTATGKPIRRALAALYVLGLLSGSVPAHGSTTVTVGTARGALPPELDQDTVRHVGRRS
jgi:hypothetical protein